MSLFWRFASRQKVLDEASWYIRLELELLTNPNKIDIKESFLAGVESVLDSVKSSPSKWGRADTVEFMLIEFGMQEDATDQLKGLIKSAGSGYVLAKAGRMVMEFVNRYELYNWSPIPDQPEPVEVRQWCSVPQNLAQRLNDRQ